MEPIWEGGEDIFVTVDGPAATVSANRAGLVSLADRLRALAESARAAISTRTRTIPRRTAPTS